MVVLWTFETVDKLNQFCDILNENNIIHETRTINKAINELQISVNENDYKTAKKLLIKNRKRKTIREHIPSHE